jgi:hypothetical protein
MQSSISREGRPISLKNSSPKSHSRFTKTARKLALLDSNGKSVVLCSESTNKRCVGLRLVKHGDFSIDRPTRGCPSFFNLIATNLSTSGPCTKTQIKYIKVRDYSSLLNPTQTTTILRLYTHTLALSLSFSSQAITFKCIVSRMYLCLSQASFALVLALFSFLFQLACLTTARPEVIVESILCNVRTIHFDEDFWVVAAGFAGHERGVDSKVGRTATGRPGKSSNGIGFKERAKVLIIKRSRLSWTSIASEEVLGVE